MIFKIPDSERRRARRRQYIQRWHPYFTLWPRRVDAETVVWLQYVARRRAERIKPGYTTIKERYWEYGPAGYVVSDPRESTVAGQTTVQAER